MAIWNLGSINADHVYRLQHLPLPGETLAADSYAVGLGGKGGNQSIAAAQAGTTPRHLGAVGSGDRWIVERLQALGIDCSAIQMLPDEATGHALILLDTEAENSIIIHPGANRAIEIRAMLSALSTIGAGDTLLIQNETNGQVEAARAARQAGARVIYSAAPFQIDAVRQILPHVSVLAMNEGEARELFEAIPGDLPVEGLLITRGAAGAEYRDLITGRSHHHPAFKVQPVDTTGAGDTFAGYFAACTDRGDDIDTALRLASAAAALQVTRQGAGEAIPGMQDTLAFLDRQPA